jgi:hypothetical protein
MPTPYNVPQDEEVLTITENDFRRSKDGTLKTPFSAL